MQASLLERLKRIDDERPSGPAEHRFAPAQPSRRSSAGDGWTQ